MSSVSPLGVVYYESEYESAELSIEDFFGLATSIYAWQWYTVAEAFDFDDMLANAYKEEADSYWVGPMAGHIRIFWTACDGECKGIRPGRN